PLMAGNWKMHLNHLEAIVTVQKLAFTLRDKDYDAVDVVVLPPFPDLRSVQTLVMGDRLRIGYGAQDLSPHDDGAHTGDVSGSMLAKLACTYVVVGHSERRANHQEDDALVNAKLHAALRHGLVPILCVGEGLDVRQAGEQVGHTLAQLDRAVVGLSPEQLGSIVVAYEPVWAIGTGEVATPENAQEVCRAIRGLVRDRAGQEPGREVAGALRVLYGGSVKSSNVGAIMDQPDIDGALVGGASLDPNEFVSICRNAAGPR
ncbi:MAG: triose-phosphate isomerase, partial [Actinomycetes bacterium]